MAQQKILEMFNECLNAERNSEVKGNTEAKYSRVGTTTDGRGIYKTNYKQNTPKKIKQQDIVSLVQNVWSKKPIDLKIGKAVITASFNPDLSEKSDLAKIAFGNRKGNASEKRITLNLSSDLYQIAKESKYNGSKQETGKLNPAHKDVQMWKYFVTNLVYQEDNGEYIDCHMNIDVKQDKKGHWFYSFAIEKGNAPQTLLAEVTDKESATFPTNNIPQIEEKSKAKFSLKENVEQSKDLIAVHNISEEKLLKSLRLGGLPMPSIAVARAEYGHTDFGKISLVFPKSTIDPSNSSNEVYSGDAYTPTYPQIEYKLSSKASDLYSRALKLRGAPFYKSVRYDPDNVLDRIKVNGINDFIKKEIEDYGLKQLYLYETTGETVPMQYTTKRSELDANTVEAYDYIINAMGNTLTDINGQTPREWLASHKDEFIKAYRDYYKSQIPNITEEQLDNVMENEFPKPFSYAARFNSIRRYIENGAVEEETIEDADKTEKMIDERINISDYKKWAASLFDGIIEKEGIRNSRDLYTSAGDRRSFEALHYEHTLENVVRAMQEQGKQGIGLLGMNIFGSSKVQYNSVKDIKANSNKLINGNDENAKAQYEAKRDELSHRFFELASALPKDNGSFLANDDAANVLIEAVLKNSTKTGMDNYIRRELQGWANYSPSIVDDLMAIVDDIRALPAAYFEAKPQRAVTFDEVYTAIIPDNSSDELIEALEESNVDYKTYKSGDDKARIKILNSLNDVKFSRKESAAEPSDTFEKEVLNSFDISKPSDYRHVQIQVYDTLVNEGFFDDNGRRIETNADSGMQVEINESGIEETFNLKNYAKQGKNLKILKLASVRAIPGIIKSGILVEDDVNNYHNENSTVKYGYIEGNRLINGESYTIQITVRKSLQKNKFWVHNIYTNKNTTNGLPAGENSKTGYLTDSGNDMLTQDESVVKYSRKENLTPTGRFVMNLLDENEELRQASDDLKDALMASLV